MVRPLVLLTLAGCSALAELPLDKSGETEPAVARLVATLLAQYHYDGRTPDDAIAREWMENYLQNLDFNHVFFLQSDVDAFMALATTLDDDIRSPKPKLDVAKRIYDRYRQRVAERVADANAILDGPIDLTDDESYRFDRKDAPWPRDAAEARELWRKRIEEQFILGALAGRSEDDTRDLLRKRYHRLLTDVNAAEPMDILERYLTAFTTTFDPHTVYFKPATQDNFDIEMQNSLEGIGASLRTVGEYTVVAGLIPGGPAEKGGELQVNDKIIAVAQGDGEPVDVIDLHIDKVVQQIRGKKGTEVRLTVIPADATDPGETRVVRIIRDKVVLADSDADLTIHEVEGRRYAVIEVPSFYADPSGSSASRDVERILRQDMLADGPIEGVILDLRQNGGGSLQEAVNMTGLFIDRGPVVQIRDGGGDVEVLSDRRRGMAWEGPLVVLTSPLSASASEIVAGALQDYGRALVVGSRTTHGKGTVQTLIGLSDMMARFGRKPPRAGALKLTTQKFYRVNGASTQVKGVMADVVIPSPWDGLDVYEADLDNALPWDTIAPVSYTPVGRLQPLLPELQAASEARVASSEAFQKMAEARAERERLKREKTVSLNLAVREKEKREGPTEPNDTEDGQTSKEDPVLDEALRVLADYTRAQG